MAFAFLSAVHQESAVMNTIGKGIIRQNRDSLVIWIMLICTGFFLTSAICYRIQTATSQAVVVGGLGTGLLSSAEINASKLITTVPELGTLSHHGQGLGRQADHLIHAPL